MGKLRELCLTTLWYFVILFFLYPTTASPNNRSGITLVCICAFRPRVEAGKHTLPGHKTPQKGLYFTGDYTFPGIGVPATAASGAITANTILSVFDHWKILDKIRLPKRTS